MKPERLIYTFVSYASHYDTDWAKGTPIEGVERTARLAHKHGVPVTWIVNGGSVPVLAERIREWHEAYGDDVILQTPFFLEDCGASKAKFRAALDRDWKIVAEAFPWVRTKIAARGKIYNEVIEVLEELDFKGMWGYCWEQIWWDGISHRGIPWGSWYVDRGRYKAPHAGKGHIVACEWTARDLHATYHSGCPVIYSTDPNDVLRAGLCGRDDIEYWKRLFQDYLDNTEHNDRVYFLQQQEAHEMEYTERFAVFPASHVEACEGMLDLFFAHITQYPITLTTLPKAVEEYHERNAQTAPAYMLTRDTLSRPEVNEYTVTLGGTGAGPWPRTFLYYDRECQMAFVHGQCAPHRLRSYVGKGDMHDEFEESVPQVWVSGYERTEDRIRMTFKTGHGGPLPFGLAYWDDLAGFAVEACSEGVSARIIGDELVFLRFGLTGEPATIALSLTRREPAL
ncbi:polysaccharide deacetylase family protein [Paenibacillus xanthanilyticus]|uniref:Uncharacterized protein n=1 Tax=Paenibacillus xanthanilyticus TaxID=1783531 RepID=A0ABV8KBJ6_9BACL